MGVSSEDKETRAGGGLPQRQSGSSGPMSPSFVKPMEVHMSTYSQYVCDDRDGAASDSTIIIGSHKVPSLTSTDANFGSYPTSGLGYGPRTNTVTNFDV